MELVLKAVYKNGVLVPDRSLGADKEGKSFKLVLVEEEASDGKKERFFRFVEEHAFTIPDDYSFNRDDLYEIDMERASCDTFHV
jgi:predicted DNA-binding antitoxin AbrB/MazE fold protein